MIKTTDLTIDYGQNNGIFNINLTIPNGAIYALIGHSGCGKSTLLSTLAGLLKNDSGTFKITDHQDKPTNPGLIQQKDALFPWYTVKENVALGLIGDTTQEEKIKTILNELNIEKHQDHYPAQLSGGQRQRVSIARTLVSNPDVLLMDEPTASLDAFTKENLQDMLLKLYLQHQQTTFFVTHSIEEAVFLAQKILVMDQGTIVHIYDNPLEHDLNLRRTNEFYEVVNELRTLLGDINDEE
jgi:NitT/TauT family transport system ATP-binding protein